jgi:hypothetical protein
MRRIQPTSQQDLSDRYSSYASLSLAAGQGQGGVLKGAGNLTRTSGGLSKSQGGSPQQPPAMRSLGLSSMFPNDTFTPSTCGGGASRAKG